jgi:hypothetical protein
LDRLSDAALRVCSPIEGPESRSVYVAQSAISKNERGRFKEAAAAAELCIKIYYANPECHLQHATALYGLGRVGTALAKLEVAGRLAEHALQEVKRQRLRPRNTSEDELLSAQLENYQAQLGLIRKLRADWDE